MSSTRPRSGCRPSAIPPDVRQQEGELEQAPLRGVGRVGTLLPSRHGHRPIRELEGGPQRDVLGDEGDAGSDALPRFLGVVDELVPGLLPRGAVQGGRRLGLEPGSVLVDQGVEGAAKGDAVGEVGQGLHPHLDPLDGSGPDTPHLVPGQPAGANGVDAVAGSRADLDRHAVPDRRLGPVPELEVRDATVPVGAELVPPVRPKGEPGVARELEPHLKQERFVLRTLLRRRAPV